MILDPFDWRIVNFIFGMEGIFNNSRSFDYLWKWKFLLGL